MLTCARKDNAVETVGDNVGHCGGDGDHAGYGILAGEATRGCTVKISMLTVSASIGKVITKF